MLFNRQKELLYMVDKLQQSGKTKLQKLMFLSTLESDDPSFDFFPYRYGPYSITLQHDLDQLCKNDFLAFADEKYTIKSSVPIKISAKRKAELDDMLVQFGHNNTNDLMKYVSIHYPRYAINSIKAQELLTAQEMDAVTSCKPKQNELTLFTIGYEGKSIDKYLSQLIENNIQVLVDVRASSYSMKKEFIGSNIAKHCKMLEIEYLHIPEMGIPTSYRKEFQNKTALFTFYSENLLPQHNGNIGRIMEILNSNKRISLTCFEADFKNCHRHVLAEEIRKRTKDLGWSRIPILLNL